MVFRACATSTLRWMALPLVCPAAVPVHPAGDVESVRCGVLAESNVGESIDGFTHRAEVDPIFSGSRDSGTVNLKCAGDGVPGSELSYCTCVIWQSERDAADARRRGPGALVDPASHRPPASRSRR